MRKQFMKYRSLGRLNWNPSALGFGAMRLPIIGGDRTNIDEPRAIHMMRHAFDHGINYVDSAYPYHGGNSEVIVGKALQDGYRDKVKLATKMPVRILESKQDLDTIFMQQLTKLQTNHIDFYLFHGLNRDRWQKIQDLQALDWAETKIANGQIEYLGFSFHDEFPALKTIIDEYSGWTFCQIHYNYIDTQYQAGEQGLKYAASKGLGVVIMEPLQGGNLTIAPPSEIQTLWDTAPTKRTLAEWGLLWLWNQPEVSLVLSGMSTMTQVVENLESTNRSGVGCLTEKELLLFSQIRSRHQQYGFIGCTGCQYCLPCAQDVAIPEILSSYNQFYRHRGDSAQQETAIEAYQEHTAQNQGPSSCVQCNSCLVKCPQELPIPRLLERAARYLDA
jgi:predicted aldo/keto reductase-like oxidoreductase